MRRELLVVVAHWESRLKLFLIQPRHQVSTLLLHLTIDGRLYRRADQHPDRVRLVEDQLIRQLRAQRRDDALDEEVAGDHCVHMEPDELAPRGLCAARGLGGRRGS